MKKLILYIIPLLMILTGCKDGTLDRYPLDAVSAPFYFQTADQLQQYTNQFYTILPSAGSMYEEVSDLVAVTTLPSEATGSRTVPATASNSSWTWGTLRHINFFLEHVGQCTNQAARDQYTGIALFFRAYFYYDKVRRFGDVPWIDHTLGNNDEELYKARDSRTLVMQNVVKDLDSAISLMPNEKPNAYAVNRYTAMALKSRACLFEGTFCKYHNVSGPTVQGMPYWQYMLTQAADAAGRLMKEGGYTLYDVGTQPYRDMFMMNDLRACPEIIMARGYDGSMGLKHNVCSYTISASTGRPGFTKRLVNQYLKIDGTRFTDQTGYEQLAMGPEMKDRDPRLEQTMFFPGHYIRKGKTEQEAYDPRISSTGYQIIKYVTEEAHDSYNNSENDMPIFRLAEVYLNYAEALAELGKITQDDINASINRLRERAGMTGMLDLTYAKDHPCAYMESLYPNVDKGDYKGVILEIRRERTVELVLEGHRYWDLMRWKEGKAFEQPYYGFSVAKVTQSKTDKSGYMDMNGDGKPDMCIWTNGHPKVWGAGMQFYEAQVDLKLSKGLQGGFVLSNGTPDNLTGGRHWDEKRDYLYPLPTQEIVLSNGALTQNPNW